ncbi:allophanate hydrolase [Acrocarpospora phusangensis]|uniref:Allophanate hydrolase n=1 Tax=Acrocarpospora phusangensis TaxID=1070424 RepID=A0A919Q8M6_9ACTN|nr:allophanate hydrolase subunit 1 [Acrocarpospora phusangensis]GIH24524.1 allophanate hydrolase [Acrocarpospora phusangensis]
MTGASGVLRRVGERALLVETGALAESHRLDAALRGLALAGVEEIVPGPETVLVVAAEEDFEEIWERVEAVVREPGGLGPDAGPAPAEVVVEVEYDGADLAVVAELTGLSVDEVVARHCASPFVVGWLGFAPGFAYLVGLDPALEVPRLEVPRTSVPGGSVAIAGRYSAIYPAASPGGWRLLGRTRTRVWDVTAEPPSLLRPGTRVRMVAA